MRIREATAADVPQMARVHVEGWRSAYRGILPDAVLDGLSVELRQQMWGERLDDPDDGSYFYVAEDDDGQVVGIIYGVSENAEDPAYPGYIYALYIIPSHHRRGIGRLLLAAAADHLFREGITALCLGVFKGNVAYDFYLRLGGTPLGEHTLELSSLLPDIREPTVVTENLIGWLDTRALRSRA
jgi:ribosomal protein S18 acetylase RimI-like enzyme